MAPVPFSVHEHIAERAHHARRGHPAIPAGTKLFLIALPGGGWFSYSYVFEDAARAVADKLDRDRSLDPNFNRRADPEHCLHSHIRE